MSEKTSVLRTAVWERSRNGESVSEIARALNTDERIVTLIVNTFERLESKRRSGERPLPDMKDALRAVQSGNDPKLFRSEKLRIFRSYLIALLGTKRGLVRILNGVTDSQARSACLAAERSGVRRQEPLPGDVYRAMLESAFAAFYRRIAGDEVFDEENVPHVLEAWGKTIEAFSGNAFSAFHPHLDDASLFFETALRIREGIKRYRLCPFCRTVHLSGRKGRRHALFELSLLSIPISLGKRLSPQVTTDSLGTVAAPKASDSFCSRRKASDSLRARRKTTFPFLLFGVSGHEFQSSTSSRAQRQALHPSARSAAAERSRTRSALSGNPFDACAPRTQSPRRVGSSLLAPRSGFLAGRNRPARGALPRLRVDIFGTRFPPRGARAPRARRAASRSLDRGRSQARSLSLWLSLSPRRSLRTQRRPPSGALSLSLSETTSQ